MPYGASSLSIDTKRQVGEMIEVDMTNEKIPMGAFCSIDSAGNACLTKKTASAIFLGVAAETVDNSAGSAGAKKIKIWQRGIFEYPSGTTVVKANHIGQLAWAATESANAQTTIVLADPGATATPVGRVVERVDANTARIKIDGYAGIQAADAS